jgi:DNA-binding transcriptional regulator GbsR (MarR family)
MQLAEAKEQFIDAWGVLGTSWGINKTMAQLFALLIISPEPLSVEELMEELQISRGNVSMNLRALMDWNLVRKTLKKGDRKEYYYTEKDFWSLARVVAAERRKREVEPILRLLSDLENVDDKTSPEGKAFNHAITDIHEVVSTTDNALKQFTESDNNWLSRAVTWMLSPKKRIK